MRGHTTSREQSGFWPSFHPVLFCNKFEGKISRIRGIDLNQHKSKEPGAHVIELTAFDIPGYITFLHLSVMLS